jgi:microcystin-dependent protein
MAASFASEIRILPSNSAPRAGAFWGGQFNSISPNYGIPYLTANFCIAMQGVFPPRS